MPTVRERKSSKQDDGNTHCDGEDASMEVIDVSDNEANDNERPSATEEVDLTEGDENQDDCERNPPESPAKDSDDAEETKEEYQGEKRIGLPKPNEKRPRSEGDCEEQVEDDYEDNEFNSEGEPGTGIAVTRTKRNSVRRPARPGDFEFDYGDSTDFDEEEDGDHIRPSRAQLESQRNSRASAVDAEEEAAGESDSSRRNRKRSAAAEGQASQKRRRRNQTAVDDGEDMDSAEPDVPLTRSHNISLNTSHANNGTPSGNDSNGSNGGGGSNNNNNNGRNTNRLSDSKAGTPSNGSGDDSDLFCWVCHRYGKVICCETCVRVYHMRCLNLTTEPSDDWFCPECADSLLDAQPMLNLLNEEARRPTVSQEELVPLLLHAVKKMSEVPSSEPFHEPVDTVEVNDYDTYIVNPMSLSILEDNVKEKKYSSVGSFMSDARWIVHNCIVYNGASNPLTAISRQILKQCRFEIREITACPDCYRYQMEAEEGSANSGKSWFSKLCRIPHPIVWVRLKGYPEWPAKVIEEVRRRDDNWVRTKFFGAHDYADVPFTCATFHTPIRAAVDPKTLQVEHFKEALDELQIHQRLLKEKYPDFAFPSVAVTFVPEIADNIYRRLGCRQTRVVCATIGGAATTATSGDNGSGPAAHLGSRRSSSESVSSSVFASGSNVHMYRAKPISDTKTRLVSVAMGSTAAPLNTTAIPESGEEKVVSSECSEKASVAANGPINESAGTSGELSSSGEPADASLIQSDGATTGHRSAHITKRSRAPSGDSAHMGELKETMEEDEEEKEKEKEKEEEQKEDDLEEPTEVQETPPPQARTDSLDKATSTEDVDDLFASLRSSSSVNSLLQRPLIELLGHLRWVSDATVSGRSRVDHERAGQTSAALACKEAECARLARENSQLRRAMAALEGLREAENSKYERETSLSEERQTVLHELKLLEVRHNYELCIAEARHSHENDKTKIVAEVRRLLTEDVKKIVAEVKRKQWCAYCRNEAFYYCCWNTSYCDANCQKKHWTTHMSTCAQTNPSLSDGAARRASAQSNQANNLASGVAPQILSSRRMLNPNNMSQLPQR